VAKEVRETEIDDVKSQLGATVLHRTLVRLFKERGIEIEGTYQLNIGGNTDFLNMLDEARLAHKKLSKTEAVQSELDTPLSASKILVEPSGYAPWLRDGKDCFITIRGTGFAGMPVKLDVKLSVQDSSNSAGVVIDAIRCCRVALDRKISGALTSISSYAMKHPPEQFTDSMAKMKLDEFIAGKVQR
jgi:myo-inositol-1-phosphate synthase